MYYAYTQDVPIYEATYAKIAERLGPAPMDRLIVHLVTVRSDGGLRYTDVSESEAACRFTCVTHE
jgi:hypothetical protein